MNSTTADPGTTPNASALERSFEALKDYGPGSPRSALLPIDEAVTAALRDQATQGTLEQRLIAALQAANSTAAREYICSKLVLIGTVASVPALAPLLGDPLVSTSARRPLEAIPGDAPAKALRQGVSTLEGMQRLGAIASLGTRKDAGSVRLLARLLSDSNPAVAEAAAAALGEIGSTRAARVLRAFSSKKPESVRGRFADALLVCARHLVDQGHKSQATALYDLMTAPGLPKHIRAAAKKGLASCAEM